MMLFEGKMWGVHSQMRLMVHAFGVEICIARLPVPGVLGSGFIDIYQHGEVKLDTRTHSMG